MTNRLAWFGILILSVTILVLRIIDFVDEASCMDFHMTRIGLHISGSEAMFIQIFIILTSVLILLKASGELSSRRILRMNKPQ